MSPPAPQIGGGGGDEGAGRTSRFRSLADSTHLPPQWGFCTVGGAACLGLLFVGRVGGGRTLSEIYLRREELETADLMQIHKTLPRFPAGGFGLSFLCRRSLPLLQKDLSRYR